MRIGFAIVFLVSTVVFAPVALAEGQCQGRFINPWSDICWSCFFPLTIGAVTVVPGSLPDTPNAPIPVCHCGVNPFTGWGLTAGYWAPAAVVDVTRHPGCMVSLGGMQLPKFGRHDSGTVADSKGHVHGFYEFHQLNFPFMNWVGDILGGTCNPDAGFGIEFLSELDPAWHDENLNKILYPALLPVVSHIVAAQVAGAADCTASTLHLPLNLVYWNAGCQGSLYPMEGTIDEGSNPIRASTLISERGIFLMHRYGLMQDSAPYDVCHEAYQYFLPKSRYRYQLFYPDKKACYPFGHTTMNWARGILAPNDSQDYAYIIWKKVNCCAYS